MEEKCKGCSSIHLFIFTFLGLFWKERNWRSFKNEEQMNQALKSMFLGTLLM